MNIVEIIAKEKTVEEIIKNVAKDSRNEDYKDLANDVYLGLLERDQDELFQLYEKKQLNYFITRIVINNINSKTSRFFYTYRRNKEIQTNIDEYIKNQTDTTIED